MPDPHGLPHFLDFQGHPVDIPVLSGPAVYGTVREVHAAMPWRSLVGSTMHLMSGVPTVSWAASSR
jgi:alpha-glucosidase